MNGTSNQAEPSAVVRTGRRRRLAGAPGGRDRAGSQPETVVRLARSGRAGQGRSKEPGAEDPPGGWRLATGVVGGARELGRWTGMGRPAAGCEEDGIR